MSANFDLNAKLKEDMEHKLNKLIRFLEVQKDEQEKKFREEIKHNDELIQKCKVELDSILTH